MTTKIHDMIASNIRNEEWSKVDAALDAAAAHADRDDRASISYWRAISHCHQLRFVDALDAVEAHRRDAYCQSLPDTMAANILHHVGRRDEALAMSARAVSHDEDKSFPGLAREAKFYRCLYLARAGFPPPTDLLDALPDDYRSMELNDGFVTKKDIVALSGKIAGSPR